jgi:DNA-binding transcriptional LysR family regulator
MDVHYTIRQLQYFVAAAQTGTMSAAASRCHVSQSALSLSISQLERTLGVKLFVRQRAKGIELTPAGVKVYQQAEALLRQAGELEARVDVERGDTLTGTLTVGCSAPLAALYIPALLTGFKTEVPLVALEFVEHDAGALLRGLRDGLFELALLYTMGLEADIDWIEVDELVPHVVLPSDHRLADDESVSLFDLANDPMILIDLSPTRDTWSRLMADLGLEPIVAYRTQSFELVRSLVGRGAGYALLFNQPTTNATYEGNTVVVKPIRESTPSMYVGLGYLAGTKLTTRASRFAEFATTALRERRDQQTALYTDRRQPVATDDRVLI